MASLHRMKRSKYWYGAITLPDGMRTFRSTGQTVKSKAVKVLAEWVRAIDIAKQGRLTETRTRDLLEDVFKLANNEELPTITLGEFLKTWLERKSPEVAPSSLLAYGKSVEMLLEFFGERVSKPIDSFARRDALAFRDSMTGRLSGTSVMKYVKMGVMIWNDALAEHTVRENIWKGVKVKKSDGNAKRRAFTFDEIRRILDQCDTDWRGMVFAGLYTGQRLGDIASLTWRQIDFERGEVHFITGKTGATLHIPMHKALKRHLLEIPSSDDPDGAVFPTLAGRAGSTLSRTFNEILQEAGLAVKRSHKDIIGKGRDGRRDVSGLSFHCLRHTATSGLKNAGVSDVVARSIIGHESEAISQIYTHIESDTMRRAVDLLPELEGGAI